MDAAAREIVERGMPTKDEVRESQRAQWNAASSAWEHYDAWVEANMRPVTDWIVTASGAAPGMDALDLACGIGQPARAVARKVLPGGRVIATDLSPQMVAATKRKVAEEGLDHVEVREMGLEEITFADASFDVVTCRFGLMFAPEPERALKEIHRVLRPGGRYAIAAWDEPSKNPFFMSMAQPLIDRGVSPPVDPSLPGPFRLSRPGELERVVRAGGLTDVRIEAVPLYVEYTSRANAWDTQTSFSVTLKNALAKLPPDDVEDIRDAVFAELAKHEQDGAVRLLATALCATGRR
jgi:ubiquinone/menaquinone biosynthesis C-methylase UbiE